MLTREEGEWAAADSEKETPKRAEQRDMSNFSKGGRASAGGGGGIRDGGRAL